MFLNDIFSQHLNESILNELNWNDQSPLNRVLLNNRGRFIHFTSVPKLGVNPRNSVKGGFQSHKDPHGIYFYPVDYLLSGVERVTTGQQYGLDRPYYFMADIDWSAPGIVLSKVTWEDVEKIASRNGWKTFLDDFRFQTNNEPYPIYNLPHYADREHPGSVLWHLLDALQKEGRIRWNQALRGIAYIYDDNNSIIHSREPHQLVVLDPRIIRNVQMGENPKVNWSTMNDEKHRSTVWKEPMLRIMQEVQKLYGGQIRWQENKERRPYDSTRPKAKPRAPAWPSIRFEVDGDQFHLKVSESWSSFSLYLDSVHGRAHDQFKIGDWNDFHNNDVPFFVERVKAAVEKVTALEGDLFFTPQITEGQAQNFIAQCASAEADFKVDTEINNRYKSIYMRAEHTFRCNDMLFTTLFNLHIGEEHFSPSITVYNAGDNFKLYATQIGKFTRDQAKAAGYDLLNNFAEGVESRAEVHGPEGLRYPKFHRDEWAAFVGWLVLNCGLDFGGLLRERYAKQIEAFEQYDDQPYLLRRITEVLGPRGFW